MDQQLKLAEDEAQEYQAFLQKLENETEDDIRPTWTDYEYILEYSLSCPTACHHTNLEELGKEN